MPPTRIIGHVFAPNGTLPIAGAVVYVPKTTPGPIAQTTTCGCTPATGGAVIADVTKPDGSFVLTDAPSGANVPLVIQIGKWRRQIMIAVAMCTDTTVDPAQSRLPKNASEGDLPHIAITTGAADSLECIVRQLGIDDTEIGTAGDARHVHLYAGFNNNGAVNAFQAGFAGGSGNFAPGMALLGQLGQYDHVLMSCEGQPTTITAADAQQLQDWANSGGQLFLEHFHRAWMMQLAWQPLAQFMDPLSGPPPTANVTIDMSFQRAKDLASWLLAIGASTPGGSITVNMPRNTVMSADPSKVQVWAHLDPAVAMGTTGDQVFTFATPLGAAPAQQCGRVVFSDMHQTGSGAAGTVFPAECPAQPLSPQEDVIAFLFFDDPTCAP
jgi:hypothetical protein